MRVKIVAVNNSKYPVFFALRNIAVGEEVSYNYGIRIDSPTTKELRDFSDILCTVISDTSDGYNGDESLKIPAKTNFIKCLNLSSNLDMKLHSPHKLNVQDYSSEDTQLIDMDEAMAQSSTLNEPSEFNFEHDYASEYHVEQDDFASEFHVDDDDDDDPSEVHVEQNPNKTPKKTKFVKHVNYIPNAEILGEPSNANLGKQMSVSTTKSVHKSEYVKPRRLCPYCDISTPKLKNHLLVHHKDMDTVRLLLEASPAKQKTQISKLRKEGIVKNIQADEEDLHKRMKRTCIKCKGVYNKKYFYRHVCHVKSKPKGVSAVLLRQASSDEEFNSQVLCHFREHGVAQDLLDNRMWKVLGKEEYTTLSWNTKGKPAKMRTMRYMRCLATIFQNVRSDAMKDGHDIQFIDLFKRKFSSYLKVYFENSIVAETTRLASVYAIKKAAETLRGLLYMNEDDIGAKSVEEFLHVLAIIMPKIVNPIQGKMKKKEK